MSFFVVDFSCFRLSDTVAVDDVYVKEMAIVSLDGNQFEQYLFKPPFDYYDIMFQATRSKIQKLQKEIGHSWNSGFVSYSRLPFILKNLAPTFTIYAKGEDKTILLKHILNNDKRYKVMDLDGYDCPPINMFTCKTNKICPFGENHECAMNRVIWLHMWWCEQSKFYKTIEAVGNAMEKVKKCCLNSPGPEVLRYLPKSFIIDYYGHYVPAKVYEDLPVYLQQDPEIEISQQFPEAGKDWSQV